MNAFVELIRRKLFSREPFHCKNISLVGNVRILPGPRFHVAATLASISLPPFAAPNY